MSTRGEQDNKAKSKRWHEAWGTRDLEAAYADCLGPTFKALFFGRGWVDRATYVRQDQDFLKAFADVSMVVEEAVAEGDLVFCRMRWKGRQVGPILDVPATHRSFEVMGFCQDRFREGLVVEHIPLFDQANLMAQLKGE